MNSLVDPAIVALLYEASQAGVKIDLVIRGMCCLYPGKEGVSESITVVSIIGRYLEHSRIFGFANNGEPEVFIGSADWMSRNLDRRVEALTPVEEPALREQLERLLDLYLEDNSGAWEMNSDGSFSQRKPGKHSLDAQSALSELWPKGLPATSINSEPQASQTS
jgi:polyphosphate kinase